MGRTFFQMLKGKLSSPTELKVYNPLRLKVGDNVTIDAIDLRDLDFKVTAVREMNRETNGYKYQSVDYQLLGSPLGGSATEATSARLRLNPRTVPDPASGLTHNVLVLSLYYECGYKDAQDQGLIDAVNAGTGEFEIDWKGQRKYYRINDLTTPWDANLKILEDLDGNGQVDDDEIRDQSIQYWDYHTELLDEASQPYTEYLFIEQNPEDGWFQIWRGFEINPEKVIAI